jgi:hypothetical protein
MLSCIVENQRVRLLINRHLPYFLNFNTSDFSNDVVWWNIKSTYNLEGPLPKVIMRQGIAYSPTVRRRITVYQAQRSL